MKRYLTVSAAIVLLAIIMLPGCAGRDPPAVAGGPSDIEILNSEYSEGPVGGAQQESTQQSSATPSTPASTPALPPAEPEPADESQQDDDSKVIELELTEINGEPKDKADTEEPPKAEIKVLDDVDAPSVGHMSERESIAKLYMTAQELHLDGRCEEAKLLLERVQPGQPYYEVVQRLIRKIDSDIKQTDAEIVMQHLLEQHEQDNVESLYRAAQRAYNAKRYADAVKLIDEAFRLDPQNARVRELQAQARQQKALQDEHFRGLHQDTRTAEFMAEVEERCASRPSNAPNRRKSPTNASKKNANWTNFSTSACR